MVTEVEMTVWIQSVWSCETVKDQIVDEAQGKSEGVYSKGKAIHRQLFMALFLDQKAGYDCDH